MDKAIHVNDRFVNYGMNFINFNSVYGINSRNCENRFDSFYCDLSKIPDGEIEIKNLQDNGCINILVMHNPPKNFRQENIHGEKSWNVFQTIVEDSKAHICLYGHTHDNRKPYVLSESGGEHCENLLCISAPSLRLAASSRTEDAYRGFNVIEFKKLDGCYNKVSVSNYELSKANISISFETDYPIR